MTPKTLVRGGCVLTLGARTSNLRQGDVLIEDGVIAEVGPSIRARDAEQVDATDTIVMPGFVDAHRHTWTSLFRNLGDRGTERSIDPVGGRYAAEDVYAATLNGLLGAAEAGITTVVDWSDVPPDDGLVGAALQAHADSGIRTVFVHPAAAGGHALGRGKLGTTTSIAFGSTLPISTDLDRIAADWERARGSGLRIHAHPGDDGSQGDRLARLVDRRLIGEDVTFLHCTELAESEAEAIASSGAGVALSPPSEMSGGLGPPPIQQLIDHGVRPGLGIDDERIAPGDMFAQMRATISLQHATVFERKLAGKAGLPKLMSTRDVIRHATVDGARVAGLRGVTGSIEPGMQADVIVLRADRPNIFPVNDPIGAVVWGMDTSNVDWVFVRGRVVMRGGVLEADVHRVRDLAEAARRRVADDTDVVASASSGGAA
ncbi:MAG TPA: amidohydrolase family protein [Actinomycetota bacterium]|nr:amidohydrolase family protein [Actinomycetota bacterium]